ncbi:hypothetical protein TRFO_34311 [Tritrichomonas foetus]|uniref:Rab-GAP TBC domain-containing protein n=1 Tax=Tritrichomonas foetus TaxID=1144522 RepID=A0A1J4JKV4_9EUKA|nr:hypothetical protein TRFO_34311 [Tritrichomonas foetus]|eukprot:OHS99281.1 hypothetical protein TRFO_34311 [Tritrichomonas foetus]
MIAQDTNINLCLINENDEPRKGLLKMQHNNGNVSLSFYPELNTESSKPKSQVKRIAQIPDNVYQLSDFTMIEMDSKDRLIVTLSGSRSHCVLYFTRDHDITHFLTYISGKVRLKSSDCNPCVYLLEPLDSTASVVTPFNATSLPQSSPHANKAPSRVSLQRIQHPGLVFKTDSEIVKLSEDEYKALFDEQGRIIDQSTFPSIFYNRDVDLSVAGDLWKLLLNPEDAQKSAEERHQTDVKNRELYKQVKRQWQATTPRQWENHPDLRKLVELLENDLEKNSELFAHFEKPAAVKRIAFNILLTLSSWNWDGAAYVEGLITFLSPFLDSFIKDADCQTVTTHEGQVIDIETAEADIFWCFEQFYEHNQLCDLVRPTTQPLLKPLFIAIGYILDENFPDLLQLLYQKHAFSLDFLRDDVSKWFTTCFQSADVRRLWISILSFTSSFQFFQCFIVSLLFSLAPQFVEMNPLNSDEFIRRFHNLKKKVELNLLLQNAKMLMEILNRKKSQGK